jgi:hypothetical protein
MQAISDKIKSLDIQDCKVRVLNVDSQSSFSNIVVQVIGEMSNKNQPHHKFVQTFVLAEQPNGYFVLNDIFRYLNDDEDEIIEDEAPQAEVPAEEPPTPVEPVPEVAATQETVTTDDALEQVDGELEDVKDEAKEVAEPAPAADVSAITDDAPIDSPAAEPEVEVEAPADEATVEEAPVETAPTEPTPPKATTPVPEAPPQKKTWASMLGGSAKPATQPAFPTQAPAAPQPKAPRPVQPAQVQTQAPKTAPTEPASSSSAQGNGWQMADHGKKGRTGPQSKTPEGNTLAYIKNVNEKVDARTLREVLERYGELKYFDVARIRVSLSQHTLRGLY